MDVGRKRQQHDQPETGSAGYLLTGIDCTSKKGSAITTDRGTATVQITNLLAADQVECVFTDEQRPQGGTLQIAKTTTGAVGTSRSPSSP